MLEEFIKHQNYLIDLEHQEEVNQLTNKISSLSGKLCQHDGLSILHLEIESMRTAMFGRCCVSLHKIDSSPISQSFKVGDEICLYNSKHKSSTLNLKESNTKENDSKNILNGLISKITMYKIDIIIDEQFQVNEHLFEPPLRLDLRSSQKTHITMKSAMQQLLKKDTEYHPLVQLLFYPNETTQYSLLKPSIKEFTTSNRDFNNTEVHEIDANNHRVIWNESLNNSQTNAIFCALSTPSVAIIHGPPGTGKTSTLTELVIQAVHRNMKVLVCAPSNIAVDTILGRLADYKSKHRNNHNHNNKSNNNNNNNNNKSKVLSVNLQMVRIGHPARISKKIMQYSLDALISKDEGTEIVFDVRNDIDRLRNDMTKKKYDHRNKDNCSNSSNGYGIAGVKGKDPHSDAIPVTRNQQRVELKQLCKEARERERAVVKRIINRSNVVLCTCVGASSRLLDELIFDMVIIDEAAQGLEAACWIPLLKGNKAILAGDHCQLPPTIKCVEADKGGLSVTLFERIIKDHRFKDVVCLLDTQYRMNSLISDWASKNMYHGAIQSHPSVANHKLEDLIDNVLPMLENINKSIIGDKDVDIVQMIDDDDVSSNKDEEDEDSVDGIATLVRSNLKVETVFPVLLLIDTSSCGMMEDISITQEGNKHGGSHRNFHEADLVQKHVYSLVKAGIKPSQIGVITPYNAQLDVLRELLLPTCNKDHEVVIDGKNKNKSIHSIDKSNKNKLIPKSLSKENNLDFEISLDGLEIKTIDGFQGGEKECILLSLVRSNPTHTVGFLGEKRRINVAVTRAKRHLAVFCDSDTCRIDPFIRNLLDHMAEKGDHISADEYIDYINTSNKDCNDVSLQEKNGYSNTNGFKTFNHIKTKAISQEKMTLVKQDFVILLQHFKKNKLLTFVNNQEYIFINNNTTNKSANNHTNESVLIRVIASSPTSLVHLDKDGSIISPNRETIDVRYFIGEEIIRFPGSINSYQRMLIHECADELQLYHRSTTNNNNNNNNNNKKSKISSNDRFIEVSLNEFLTLEHSLPSQPTQPFDEEIVTKQVTNNEQINNDIQLNCLSSTNTSKNYQDIDDKDNISINTSTTPKEQEIITNKEEELDNINAMIEGNLNKLSTAKSSITTTATIYNNNINNNNNSDDGDEIIKEAINKNKNYVKKSNNSTNNKIYISKARATYQELMEKQLLKKLNSTENAKDDDFLIEAAILHNQELAHYNQYKISSTPIPNPDKIKNKELIRNKLVEAVQSRQKKTNYTSNNSTSTTITNNNSSSSSIGLLGGCTNIHGFLSNTTNSTNSTSSNNTSTNKSNTKNKKVVKKPPPNFGVGKLGTS